ncbi:endonuclease VII [Xanthomonas phage XAJ24]|uniref:Endonuclease VII n=1 Tax=Xanthomonas phage XAJ24 TaxID=1775250 RepID=A0A1I9L2B1_9CAUD|nr:endonuclease VII [Xanthomonas phage XAJ24]AMW36098.1 endonuclease VII [Xanthomonas phage XAJ24]
MAKVCNKCSKELPLSQFHKQTNSPDGLRYSCKSCTSRRMSKKYDTPEEKESQRRASVKWKYGITWEQVEGLHSAQGCACAICSRPISLSVQTKDKMHQSIRIDHCHGSGKVRGLLCDWCNVGLGRFSDSPETLRRAAAYLENNR